MQKAVNTITTLNTISLPDFCAEKARAKTAAEHQPKNSLETGRRIILVCVS
jgi:hypothetical protein